MKNRIRELRGVRGLSQAALADLLDVSRQTVNAIETGRYDPSLPLRSPLRECSTPASRPFSRPTPERIFMSRIFGFAAFAAAMWMSVAGAAFAADGGVRSRSVRCTSSAVASAARR